MTADPLHAILERLRPLLGELEGQPEALSGGITNHNYRVRLGGTDFVVRLAGRGTERLGIDRETERAAAEAAAAVGVAPAVAAFLPAERCLVTRFVGGRQATAEELRAPGPLEQVAAALRAVHAGPPLPSAFDSFRIVEDYAALARELPPAYAPAAARAAEIEAALAGPEHAPVPCHNDLLTANFLLEDELVHIVDWEYAGMGDRFFDLADLAVNNGFDDADEARLLSAYFGAPATSRRLAALRLMRLMSDFREAMWGVVQAGLSELDFDFAGYAQAHFDRLARAVADPRYPTWLREAHAEDP